MHIFLDVELEKLIDDVTNRLLSNPLETMFAIQRSPQNDVNEPMNKFGAKNKHNFNRNTSTTTTFYEWIVIDRNNSNTSTSCTLLYLPEAKYNIVSAHKKRLTIHVIIVGLR